MGWSVIEFEPTPNPNAMKCNLDQKISDHPVSCRSREEAIAVPVARQLFDAGATSVLFCDDWMTVNVASRKDWPAMKKMIRQVLSQASQADMPVT